MIREKLGEEESISLDVGDYEKIFLGNIHGLILRKRDKEDPHVMYYMISEDDGYWFYANGCYSSYWITDHQELLKYVEEWMENNCDKDDCGWKFKG